MISTRNDDDEQDVIDLTASYGYYGSFNFPIRPPTPFADDSVWPHISSQHHLDDDSDSIVTWKLPSTRQLSLRNTVSSNSSSSSRANSSWRRTLDRILKRTKSDNRKKIISSISSDMTHPYNFGIGESNREDSITSRSSGKRVHWIDDDELILNACHRFVEYFKVFIQNVINETDDQTEDHDFKKCQLALDKLNSLIDCQHINEAFKYTIQLINKQDKSQLLDQQTMMENLISHTVLSSSA